jgi:hypothetical protein
MKIPDISGPSIACGAGHCKREQNLPTRSKITLTAQAGRAKNKRATSNIPGAVRHGSV